MNSGTLVSVVLSVVQVVEGTGETLPEDLVVSNGEVTVGRDGPSGSVPGTGLRRRSVELELEVGHDRSDSSLVILEDTVLEGHGEGALLLASNELGEVGVGGGLVLLAGGLGAGGGSGSGLGGLGVTGDGGGRGGGGRGGGGRGRSLGGHVRVGDSGGGGLGSSSRLLHGGGRLLVGSSDDGQSGGGLVARADNNGLGDNVVILDLVSLLVSSGHSGGLGSGLDFARDGLNGNTEVGVRGDPVGGSCVGGLELGPLVCGGDGGGESHERDGSGLEEHGETNVVLC